MQRRTATTAHIRHLLRRTEPGGPSPNARRGPQCSEHAHVVRRTHVRIGTLFLSLLTGVLFVSASAHASQSPSYRESDDYPSNAEHATGMSQSFQLDGGITWTQQPLAGQSFQIVSDPG